MTQTALLIRTLKSQLKARGKTYADVAAHLSLSEANVKRMFANELFSLSRLDDICQMLGMEISDLVQQMQVAQARLEQLSHQQEQEITQDLLLLLVTVCVLNHWTVDEITSVYRVSEGECVRKLVKLDRLGVIDLLPGNRIKLLIAPNFRWLANGPIQRFFQEKIGREYFETSFNAEGECLIVLNGMLSAASNAEFQRKLERLAHDFNELANRDKSRPFTDRNGTTLVLAMRQWEYGLFRHMLR